VHGDDEDETTQLGPHDGDDDGTTPLAADGQATLRPTDDDRTSRFRRTNGAEATPSPDAAPAGAAADPATEVATLERPERVEGDPGETVRVLGSRRPRRTGEGPPAEAAPGTAAIGARHIEPGQTSQRSALAAWLTRAVAFLALTVVVVAVLMVLKPF
jgi:hypothetical protein